jgi:hypothetical protein
MTIGTKNRNDYIGNGATAIYDYQFKIFAASHLRVTVTDNEGTLSLLTYPTHFAVTGVGLKDGGKIELVDGGVGWQNDDGFLLDGYSLTIRRVVPLIQATDIRNQDEFLPEVHEDAFDYLMMAIQQVAEDLANLAAIVAAGGGSGSGGGTISNLTITNLLNVLGDAIFQGDVTFNGANVTFINGATFDGPDGHVFIRHLSQEVLNLILSSSGGGGGSGPGTIATGNGRLTLQSGVPIMTSDVVGATTIYYAGSLILLLNDGTGVFQPRQISELSQTLADTTKSPGATVANRNYDMFGWDDNGTIRLSRGPAWRNGGQVISGATNATPIVITANAHGLQNGDIVHVDGVRGNTAANGVWTVQNAAANTFELTGSVGNGTYAAGTGTISSRGTGAATTELELIWNTYVNKHSITNGPAAQMGTYLGTIRTNGSNTVDWMLGTVAAGGGESRLYVYNVSNQIDVNVAVQDSTVSWFYNGGIRRKNNSATFRCSFVRGLPTGFVECLTNGQCQPDDSGAGGVLIGLDSETIQAPRSSAGSTWRSAGQQAMNEQLSARYGGAPGMGFHYFQALEYTVTAGCTFFGTTIPALNVPAFLAGLYINISQ